MSIYFCIYILFGMLALIWPNCHRCPKSNAQGAGTGISTQSFLPAAKNNKNRKKVVITSFLAILFVVALRHPSMGNDLAYGNPWTGYIYSFHEISSMSWGEVISLEDFLNYEKGYILLNKLIGSIFPETQFFLAIIALISLIPIFYFIGKKSCAPLFSVVVYLSLPCFCVLYSALRQGIALALCLLSVCFIEEKKLIKFILLILFAMCFHSTCILFLLAYPVYHIKLNKLLRWGSVLVLPLVWMLKRPLFITAAKIFGREPDIDNNGAITLFVFFCAIYIFCIIYSKSEHQGYLNIFYIACCIQALGGLNAIVVRAGYYYMIILAVLLPNVIESIQCRFDRQVIKAVAVMGFVAFGIFSIYTTDWAMAYPYIPFWRSV